MIIIKTIIIKLSIQNLSVVKIFFSQIRGKINENIKNTTKTDLSSKLASYMRNRLYEADKAQNIGKTKKTFDLLNCFHSFLKRWTIHQLYGDMSIDKYGSVWCIDHCLPIASFNLLDEKEMKKCFNWINFIPRCSKKNNCLTAKIDNRLNSMQDNKAYQFLILNEKGFN